MAYIEDVWNELLVELKAELPDVTVFYRWTQLAKKNWSDIIKKAETGGNEQRFPWCIVTFGAEEHYSDGSITSVAKRLPVSILYVCKYDAAADKKIDFHVEQKIRGVHDRLVAGSFTKFQLPLDGDCGTIHFHGTDPAGMTLMAFNEPVFTGCLDTALIIGEIAPVDD